MVARFVLCKGMKQQNLCITSDLFLDTHSKIIMLIIEEYLYLFFPCIIVASMSSNFQKS